jgi:hypothetical protein
MAKIAELISEGGITEGVQGEMAQLSQLGEGDSRVGPLPSLIVAMEMQRA